MDGDKIAVYNEKDIECSVEGLDHVNIVVHDIVIMSRFYQGVLGMTVYKTASITGKWVDAISGLSNVLAEVVFLNGGGDTNIELIEYKNPVGKTLPLLGTPNTFGIRHLAFRVSDIEKIVNRCKVLGVAMEHEVQDVPTSQVSFSGSRRKRLCYFRDPEGNLLEFCGYEPPGPATIDVQGG